MAASCVWCVLLVLAPLLFADGTLQEVERTCGKNVDCVHYEQCDSYQAARQESKTLPKPSCELKRARSDLASRVCNKAGKGVCCSPCQLGHVCTPQQDCPSFAKEKRKLRSLEGGSSEHASAIEKLQKRICDRESQTVCCERGPQCVTSNPELRNLQSSSCDPANGSCLPDVGSCGLAGGEERIVGGEEARPGEFPFNALLGRKVKRKRLNVVVDSFFWTCGGALINLRYVVTAAHCHHPKIKRRQINIVRLGEYEFTEQKSRDCSGDFCLEDFQEFDIKPADVILHPGFTEELDGRTVNDIALIRLPRLARENQAVKVACLPINPTLAARELNLPDIGDGLVSYRPTVVGSQSYFVFHFI